MNRIPFVVLISALVLAGTLALVLRAAAAPVRLEVSGSVTNPCDGTTLEMSGFTQVNSTTQTDANGGQHIVFQLQTHLQGIDSNGVRYLENHSESIDRNVNDVHEFTTHNLVALIAQGSSANWVIQEIGHFTLHDDGTVTADFFFEFEDCH
jgi:hypothetical protein